MSEEHKETPALDQALPPKEAPADKRRARRRGRGRGRRGPSEAALAKDSKKVVKGYRMIVQGFNPSFNDGRLRKIIEQSFQCGVISCKIGRDGKTGKNVSAAEVIVSNKQDAMRVVRELNNASIDGRTVRAYLKGISILTDAESRRNAARAQAASLPTRGSKIRLAGKKVNPPKSKKPKEVVSSEDAMKKLDEYMSA